MIAHSQSTFLSNTSDENMYVSQFHYWIYICLHLITGKTYSQAKIPQFATKGPSKWDQYCFFFIYYICILRIWTSSWFNFKSLFIQTIYQKQKKRKRVSHLFGVTSNPTIRAESVSRSLWYMTLKLKWLLMKYFSSLLCKRNKCLR